MSPKSVQRRLSLFLTLILISLSSCATTASGPTAYISIAAAAPYATMRPCAASCLVNQGSLTCLNKGFYDLSVELACGCNPMNSCYCDANFAAKASSYISSCVNKGCGADFPGEVTGAMNLYNGYCSTANVAAAVQTSAPGVTTSTSAKTTPAANAPNPNLDANIKGSSSTTGTTATLGTTAPAASSATGEKKGLTQSDVIALAVGLGVGLPSLLLALATFCLQRKKRERQHRTSPEVHYINK
ncbi:hypothetical protein VTL71DRAFT_16187 [Oculimacula yallundae]|uniref:Extracellular membrane protein CFEM domain-containing protein n=1 Tax=Oculimacula yallundae TaxID=86028 RepID=A0ABR4CFZ6_9HELO